MRTFDDMLSKQLENEEFKKEYKVIQPELDIIRASRNLQSKSPSLPPSDLIHQLQPTHRK